MVNSDNIIDLKDHLSHCKNSQNIYRYYKIDFLSLYVIFSSSIALFN